VYKSAQDRSYLIYRPDFSAPEKEEKKLCEGHIGWVLIEGTDVDFPLMQGRDNTEFLNKDPYGNFSYSGSVFLDCACSPDLSDSFSVIYGHHMSGGRMFGCLDSFTDAEYLKEHSVGVILGGGCEYDLELFAVMNCSASEPAVFSPCQTSAERIEAFAKENARVLLPCEREGRNAVALTTCSDAGDYDRLVLLGYISRMEEDK
ncbi:MAG: class B sortase, partial [Firmicutes bacterium]|nr:class B sortase [Bacillota bacterium]